MLKFSFFFKVNVYCVFVLFFLSQLRNKCENECKSETIHSVL